jgi:hypothetical protein
MKRRRERAEVPPIVHGVKSWRLPGAGAKEAQGGDKYVHSWNEHKAADNFKQGKWNPIEDMKLLELFDEYCAVHSLEGDERLKPLTDIAKGTHEQDIWRFIAEGFKHRTLRSVMRRTIRLLHPTNNQGAFSSAEKDLFIQLVAKHGTAWKMIGRIMNRFPPSLAVLWTRIGTESNKGAWTPEEEEQLCALVARYGTRNDATGAYVDIPWARVARELATRNPEQVLRKWSSGFGERRMGLTWTAADDEALARAVAADGGEERAEVYWGELGLPGRTGTDCRRRFDQLCKRLPHHAQTPFVERVDALIRDIQDVAGAEKARTTGSFASQYKARLKRAAPKVAPMQGSDGDGSDSASSSSSTSSSAAASSGSSSSDSDSSSSSDSESSSSSGSESSSSSGTSSTSNGSSRSRSSSGSDSGSSRSSRSSGSRSETVPVSKR